MTSMHGYSVRLLRRNEEADVSNVGVQLGRLCIAQDISVHEVARRLRVSRQTVYNWFCGAHAPLKSVEPDVAAYIATLQ